MTSDAMIVSIISEHKSAQSHTRSQERFLCFGVHFSVPESVQTMRGSGYSPSTSVRLALPLKELEQDDQQSSGECSVYTFLPVKRVGLHFVVHADFDLVASR